MTHTVHTLFGLLSFLLVTAETGLPHRQTVEHARYLLFLVCFPFFLLVTAETGLPRRQTVEHARYLLFLVCFPFFLLVTAETGLPRRQTVEHARYLLFLVCFPFFFVSYCRNWSPSSSDLLNTHAIYRSRDIIIVINK